MDENCFMRLTPYLVSRNQQANGTKWKKLWRWKNFILQVTHIRTWSEGVASFLISASTRRMSNKRIRMSITRHCYQHDQTNFKKPSEACPFSVYAFTVITENTYSVNCVKTNKTCHCSTRCEYCDSALLICNHCVFGFHQCENPSHWNTVSTDQYHHTNTFVLYCLPNFKFFLQPEEPICFVAAHGLLWFGATHNLFV